MILLLLFPYRRAGEPGAARQPAPGSPLPAHGSPALFKHSRAFSSRLAKPRDACDHSCGWCIYVLMDINAPSHSTTIQ